MKKILVLLLTLSLLVSCGQTPSVDTASSKLDIDSETIENIAEYTIVIPKKSTIGERDIALSFQKKISEKLQIDLNLSFDSKDQGAKEIIIGRTSRPQSQGEFKYSDFVIKKDGDHIVINGGSSSALNTAIDLIFNEFLTDKLSIPSSEYTKTFEYPLENGTVGGILLRDFAVIGEGEGFDALRDVIGCVTGANPKTEGINQVLFDKDETLTNIQARSEFKEGNIIVYTNGDGISKAEAAQILKEIFADATLNEVSVDLTKEISLQGFNIATEEQLAQWRDETDERISEIRNTPNINIPFGATVYYVSNNGHDTNDGKSPEKAWKTLSKVSSANLNPGDYVLFERGGYFRGSLSAKAGVTYSAYGKGEKPIICGSPEDGADPSKWFEVEKNIWQYDTAFDKDIGSLVFNHGEAYATKWLVYQDTDGNLQEFKTKVMWNGVTTMTEDLHFWHNNAGYSGTDYKIYLYSTENPGKRFDSIEFLQRAHAISVGGDNITFDNLCIKYTGAHGISGGTRKKLTVSNCEFAWIGGSLQYVTINVSGTKLDRPVRYGNGVELFGGCDGFTIDNCYFQHIYDAAVTHQYDFGASENKTADRSQLNINYTNNVMEYCTYSIEYFLGSLENDNTSYIDNVLYENNYMWYAGEGLGSQRPVTTQPAHIKGWGHQNPVKNFVIRNNLLAYSSSMLIHTSFTNKNSDGAIGIKLENNTIVGKYGQNFGMFGYKTGDHTVDYTSEIAQYLEDYSNGDKFYFIKE